MRQFARRHQKLMTATLLIALVCVLILPAAALARAGGGHVGGSFHSSGGSGGSGGSFSGIPFLGGVWFGSDPDFWITVLIIVGYLLYAWIRGRMRKSVGEVTVPQPSGRPVTLDALKAEDPDFSEDAFYGRINEMFLTIQKAWEARNMEPARRFLAEQQFQVLADGVAEYVRNGQVNKLDSIHIDRIEPVSVTREGDADYVKVMITATIVDYTVDERTGEIVNPDVLGDGKTPRTFDEYWTLTRKVGAQTKADASIQKCPNCGAPVTDGNYVKCAYCGTMMNDPALDWVLLRIEQP